MDISQELCSRVGPRTSHKGLSARCLWIGGAPAIRCATWDACKEWVRNRVCARTRDPRFGSWLSGAQARTALLADRLAKDRAAPSGNPIKKACEASAAL